MFATPAQLATRLRVTFDAVATASAEDLIRGIEGRIRVGIDPEKVTAVAEDDESPEFEAVRDVVLSIAARRFANPEGVLQKRMGTDRSVSHSDSVKAAVSLTAQEKADVRSAFGVPAAQASWLDNATEGQLEPELPL